MKSSDRGKITRDKNMVSFHEKLLRIPQHFSEVLELVCLNRNNQYYRVNYQNLPIGWIKAGKECWVVNTDLAYGAAENKYNNSEIAINWLVNNYLRISDIEIQFEADETCQYCFIQFESISIEIKQFDEESFLASIQNQNQLDFEYFPDLQSAIVYSFGLIVECDYSIANSQNIEF